MDSWIQELADESKVMERLERDRLVRNELQKLQEERTKIGVANPEEVALLDAKIKKLEELKMPDKIREILEKDSLQLEEDLQTELADERIGLTAGKEIIKGLNQFEQSLLKDPTIVKLLLVHHIYAFLQDKEYLHSHGLTTSVESIDELLDKLVTKDTARILATAIEDNTMKKVLPTEVILNIATRLNAHVNLMEYPETLNYWNHRNDPVSTLEQTLKQPIQVFSPIQDFLLLPHQIMASGYTNRMHLTSLESIPGSKEYMEYLAQVKEHINQQALDAQQHLQEQQNFSNVADDSMYYVHFINKLLKDSNFFMDMQKFVTANHYLEQTVPKSQEMEATLMHVQSAYTPEELQRIIDSTGMICPTEGPNAYDLVEKRDHAREQAALLDEKIEKKCASFDVLYQYAYAGKNPQEFQSADVEEEFYQYFLAQKGHASEEQKKKLEERIEKYRKISPEMVEHILKAYETSDVVTAYDDLEAAKEQLEKVQNEPVKGGFLGLGKKERELEKEKKVEEQKATLEQKKQDLKKAKESVAKGLTEQLSPLYQEIVKVIPDAKAVYRPNLNEEVPFTEVDKDELSTTYDGQFTTNISAAEVQRRRADYQREAEETDTKIQSMLSNNPVLIRHVNDKDCPRVGSLKDIVSGKYAQDMFENKVYSEIQSAVMGENSKQM